MRVELLSDKRSRMRGQLRVSGGGCRGRGQSWGRLVARESLRECERFFRGLTCGSDSFGSLVGRCSRFFGVLGCLGVAFAVRIDGFHRRSIPGCSFSFSELPLEAI